MTTASDISSGRGHGVLGPALRDLGLEGKTGGVLHGQAEVGSRTGRGKGKGITEKTVLSRLKTS